MEGAMRSAVEMIAPARFYYSDVRRVLEHYANDKNAVIAFVPVEHVSTTGSFELLPPTIAEGEAEPDWYATAKVAKRIVLSLGGDLYVYERQRDGASFRCVNVFESKGGSKSAPN
jgi:hypothetical protein